LFCQFSKISTIPGLFDRAKKKFLGDKEPECSGESSQAIVAKASSLYDVDYWQHQDLGKQRYK